MLARIFRNHNFSSSQAFIILIFLFTYLIWTFFTWELNQIVPAKTFDATAYTAPLLPESPIDLNRADFYDLQLLPFIGRGYATKILEYRERHGGFKSVYELKSILKIDQYKFEKLKPYVTIL